MVRRRRKREGRRGCYPAWELRLTLSAECWAWAGWPAPLMLPLSASSCSRRVAGSASPFCAAQPSLLVLLSGRESSRRHLSLLSFPQALLFRGLPLAGSFCFCLVLPLIGKKVHQWGDGGLGFLKEQLDFCWKFIYPAQYYYYYFFVFPHSQYNLVRKVNTK